jgi:F-type H+-transporting ATPase subunit alpha
MSVRSDVADWLTRSSRALDHLEVGARYEAVGTVAHYADGVALVSGLPETQLNEVLRLGETGLAIALGVTREQASCVLLTGETEVTAGAAAYRTGSAASVPVGEALLGRVVDPLGSPLDGGSMPRTERRDPVERPAPGIIDRDFVEQPLATGIVAIDSMIPLGRGQRQLVIGDRKTGKTALAIDTIINQRRSDVISVYAAVGQKDSAVAQAIEAVRKHGAPERTVFVVGRADAPAGQQWLAPYAACAIAEFFRDRGQDALLVIDDLTKHAAIYRQLSLLLRHPPGREAYPGDVFYMHSRLLERAAKLSKQNGGGSLTALPIAETQAGNLSAYIPTNLISITDGQIYLEPKLFYEGHKPAVNVGLSVSRVGAKAQPPVLKSLAQHLRLAYAQFLELEVFTRFGTMMDERTKATIERGRRIRAALSQPQNAPLALAEETALLLALAEGLFDALPLTAVGALRTSLRQTKTATWREIAARIGETGVLSDADRGALLSLLRSTIAELPREKTLRSGDAPAS